MEITKGIHQLKVPIPNNPLENLDISNNLYLDILECRSIQIDSLDVSNNTELQELSCDDNHLATIDFSNNPYLNSLTCGNNLLTNLDVSNNPYLNYLECGSNLLDSLDISNNGMILSLIINNIPTLYKVCVWTIPFPPGNGSIYVDSEGSPNIYFTDECN